MILLCWSLVDSPHVLVKSSHIVTAPSIDAAELLLFEITRRNLPVNVTNKSQTMYRTIIKRFRNVKLEMHKQYLKSNTTQRLTSMKNSFLFSQRRRLAIGYHFFRLLACFLGVAIVQYPSKTSSPTMKFCMVLQRKYFKLIHQCLPTICTHHYRTLNKKAVHC